MAPPNNAPQYKQDSITMAEVGDIVKVSGSRIATPLAPPRPGQHADQHPEDDADEHQTNVWPGSI